MLNVDAKGYLRKGAVMNGFRKDMAPRKKRNSGGSLGQKLLIEGTANLKNFVYTWNRRHNELKFALIDDTMIGRPVQIEVRFSRSKFMDLCDAVNFERFCEYIDIHSHQTLFVTDDERLFENGIIEIKVATLASNYRNDTVYGILDWISSKFFTIEHEETKEE